MIGAMQLTRDGLTAPVDVAPQTAAAPFDDVLMAALSGVQPLSAKLSQSSLAAVPSTTAVGGVSRTGAEDKTRPLKRQKADRAAEPEASQVISTVQTPLLPRAGATMRHGLAHEPSPTELQDAPGPLILPALPPVQPAGALAQLTSGLIAGNLAAVVLPDAPVVVSTSREVAADPATTASSIPAPLTPALLAGLPLMATDSAAAAGLVNAITFTSPPGLQPVIDRAAWPANSTVSIASGNTVPTLLAATALKVPVNRPLPSARALIPTPTPSDPESVRRGSVARASEQFASAPEQPATRPGIAVTNAATPATAALPLAAAPARLTDRPLTTPATLHPPLVDNASEPGFSIDSRLLGPVSAALTPVDAPGNRLHVQFTVDRAATAALIAGSSDRLDQTLDATGMRLGTLAIDLANRVAMPAAMPNAASTPAVESTSTGSPSGGSHAATAQQDGTSGSGAGESWQQHAAPNRPAPPVRALELVQPAPRDRFA